MGPFAEAPGEADFGTEKTPVAELALPEPSGGGGAVEDLPGLPNICVNSPGCADGRAAGCGVAAGDAALWLPAGAGYIGD